MRAGDATIASVLAQANQRQELTGHWVGSEFVWISEVHAKELPKGRNAKLIVPFVFQGDGSASSLYAQTQLNEGLQC